MTAVQRRRLVLAVAVVVLVVAIAISRSTAGVDDGAVDRAVPITAPPAPAPGPTTPAAPLIAPDVATTRVDFDLGMPHDVNFHDVTFDPSRWEGSSSTAVVATPVPVSAEAPSYDAARDWLVDAGSPAQIVEVKLVTPTPHTGVLARFQDARTYLAVVTGADLGSVELLSVRDGTPTTVGVVDHQVSPGTTIGLVALGNDVTISIDGRPQVLSTSSGTRSAVSDQGLEATNVGLLVGSGQPVFDDLRFG